MKPITVDLRMDYTTVLVPNGPTITMHKGWRESSKERKTGDTVINPTYDRRATTRISHSSNADAPKARQFPFIDTTRLAKGSRSQSQEAGQDTYTECNCGRSKEQGRHRKS